MSFADSQALLSQTLSSSQTIGLLTTSAHPQRLCNDGCLACQIVHGHRLHAQQVRLRLLLHPAQPCETREASLDIDTLWLLPKGKQCYPLRPCGEGIALSMRPLQPAKCIARVTSMKPARQLGRAVRSAILIRSKGPNQIWDLFGTLEHKLHTNCQHALKGLKPRKTHLLHFQLQLLPFSLYTTTLPKN